jgi:hypothetical protein
MLHAFWSIAGLHQSKMEHFEEHILTVHTVCSLAKPQHLWNTTHSFHSIPSTQHGSHGGSFVSLCGFLSIALFDYYACIAL